MNLHKIDPFSGNSTGAYSNAATVHITTKTRSYAGSAYGIPALQRPNFHLITEATIHKILFEKTSGGIIATGVLASVHGKTKQYTATKEVSLAAGVFNTPKLLELSGIGDENLLKKHDIPVVISNSGVGENMQDHLMTGVSFEIVDGVPTGDPLLRQEPRALELAQKLYTENKAGPFTIGGIRSHAFMPILEFSDAEGRQKKAELLTSILQKYPPKPQDVEHFEAVRSFIESPEAFSAAWLIILAQTNLHEGGKSFVGSDLQPEKFTSLVVAKVTRSLEDLLTSPHQTLMMYLKLMHNSYRKRNHPDSFHIHSLERAKNYILNTAVTAYHNRGTTAMLQKKKGVL
ncbi:hypothetical protein BPOR_0709g00090 [Botrytis porri]|uniref:Glucose-methanol-choline oxidoreductase N-terminal domain-containing protein n=1 Tax=Botrytis porri TaxID=87229 RepID=A0A4Z1KAB2_9HELO|nr:hypothetical protein BPOR_0709g00090 [Botrytis porri]